MRRKPTKKMIFSVYLTDKGLIPRKYPKFLHVIKKDTHPNRKMSKRLKQGNRYSNDKKYLKKHSILLVIREIQAKIHSPESQK